MSKPPITTLCTKKDINNLKSQITVCSYLLKPEAHDQSFLRWFFLFLSFFFAYAWPFHLTSGANHGKKHQNSHDTLTSYQLAHQTTGSVCMTTTIQPRQQNNMATWPGVNAPPRAEPFLTHAHTHTHKPRWWELLEIGGLLGLDLLFSCNVGLQKSSNPFSGLIQQTLL